MQRRLYQGIIAAGWLFFAALGLGAEMVDPRNPAEWQLQRHAFKTSSCPWSYWKIRQLEAERNLLLQAIAALPQHDPRPQRTQLGYHSGFDLNDPSASHQLSFVTKNRAHLIGSIALVPAFNPESPIAEVYAFPNRFKIEVLNADSGELEEVVNWMDEDFPVAGTYPVFFADINLNATEVRLTVPGTAHGANLPYFAMGEIYLFRESNTKAVWPNIASWTGLKVEVSDGYIMPPFWDLNFVRNRIDGLGFPLSDQRVPIKDFLVLADDEAQLAETVQVTIKLTQSAKIDRIEFWPAEAPGQMASPGFGFPGKVSVETAMDAEFTEDVWVPRTNDLSQSVPEDAPMSIWMRGHRARYVRVTLSDLPLIGQKRVLGFGEIRVSGVHEILTVGSEVTATGLSPAAVKKLPRLVDGFSGGRRILLEMEWIKGLAKRRPLDYRLEELDQELRQARIVWRHVRQRMTTWGSGLIGVILIGGLLFQHRHRNRVLKILQSRIMRDLHDDVGSSLGSISLMAEDLVSLEQSETIQDDLKELSLMAREASASLREVVWVISQETILLPVLLKKLAERAERVLGGVDLTLEFPEECSEQVVSLTVKRHLIMFFKEALHNCAQHAHATQVRFSATTSLQFLRLVIHDNGCGFDVSAPRSGWGVNNMEKRAKELGGELHLTSRPGGGTRIVLEIPLGMLSKEPKNPYGTSN